MRPVRLALAIAAVAATAGPCLAVAVGPQADLKGYLARPHVGKAESYHGLTLYPLVTPRDFALGELLTLDEALKRKALVVTELEGGAEVNTLMLENVSARPIFIMSGEIMRGAKQDRTMQNDLLIPPKSGKMKVSVFCTEHGRWTETSRAFQASDQAVPNSVRQSAKVGKEQSRVWSSIAQNQAKLGAAAPTGAAKDVYENQQVKQDLQPFVDHLKDLAVHNPGTVGVVAVYGDRLVALDLFGDDALFARLYPKLLRSYAVDVLSDKPTGGFSAQQATGLLGAMATADWVRRPTEGVGQALEMTRKDLHGSALLDGARTLHTDLFEGALASPEPEERMPIPDLNQRRQRNSINQVNPRQSR